MKPAVVPVLDYAPPRDRLARKVFWLALPVVFEQMSHASVGVTDTWLANQLVAGSTAAANATNAAAGAAVGNVQNVLWLMGLVSGAIGTGATAIISRAVGARDRRTANAICGQAVSLALLCGFLLAIVLYVGAPSFAAAAQMHADARVYFVEYVRLLCLSLPLTLLMFAAGAALRGAGDTLTPSIAMVIVDLVNFVCTVGLTHGRFGLPAMGFDGIAIGTCIAYTVGGLMLLAILFKRRGFMRLYPHRMRPHWAPLKRILRLGLPNGVESGLHWIANFAVVGAANHLGNAAVTAHWNAIRIESVSFLTGMGFAVAAQTLVGQSLGMGEPKRARRCAYLAYAMGGGAMALAGVVFVIFGRPLAGLLSQNPEVIDQTTACIRTTGVIQWAFAASLIFGSAMRGAGDTLRVMQLNLATIFGIRFVGVVLVVYVYGLGLQAVWYCLCGDLLMRGILMAARFRFGAWDRAKV